MEAHTPQPTRRPTNVWSTTLRTFDRFDTFGDALAQADSRAVLEEHASDLLQSSMATQLAEFPLGPFLEFSLSPDAARAALVLDELSRIVRTKPDLAPEPPIVVRDDYEPVTTQVASARVLAPASALTYEITEVVLQGPSHGNPFVDVDLTATFAESDSTIAVGGFYDGDGTYRIRFLPPHAGNWEFTTSSNARSLREIHGTIAVADGPARGPVGVVDQFGFAHADGTPYAPFGTTAYAWTHQSDDLQDQTIVSLAKAPFNKIRMCLFPKSFMYNSNEPEHFVFPRAEDGSWDTTRFNLDYFANLERRLTQLDSLGIQADLILFHPYDRWGLSTLGQTVDERYLTYVVRRLAAFPHVWWSLANEYELLTTKRPSSWHRFAEIVGQEDHAGHLLSIHNWSELYDYSAPWATHCSIQRGDRDMAKKVDAWRLAWGKPVVVDEAGYEGDIDQGWGNHTPQAVLEIAWSAAVRGGYVSHGETFHDADEVLWWSKGGALKGDAVARLAFLRDVVEASPIGRLDPLPSDWDVPWGGVTGQYVIQYFGAVQPRFRHVAVPAGMRAHIDVIDTWNMTIETLPGVHEGTTKVDLPARPYMAIRLRAAQD
ncbi:DUF5605 domain-containing protein [Demequina sp.]|uniref:DUF5605 domain-containing protein n=1 Tax=Demequina sp. TaxID=2050685 RepID=UPI003A839E50